MANGPRAPAVLSKLRLGHHDGMVWGSLVPIRGAGVDQSLGTTLGLGTGISASTPHLSAGAPADTHARIQMSLSPKYLDGGGFLFVSQVVPPNEVSCILMLKMGLKNYQIISAAPQILCVASTNTPGVHNDACRRGVSRFFACCQRIAWGIGKQPQPDG